MVNRTRGTEHHCQNAKVESSPDDNWARAAVSWVGPGQGPGLIKPDLVLPRRQCRRYRGLPRVDHGSPDGLTSRSIQTYSQRVRQSILPLSLADTLPKAFEEWRFTRNAVDHEEPCKTCELCGQEGLRYHFEIGNAYTDHTLQVGSHCILQFNLAVYDEDGWRLSPKDAKKKLDRLTEQLRLESCIRALEKLARVEDSDILQNALAYYRKNKKLTPKQAFVVFWRLRHHRIDHAPSFFKIALKKKRYMKDFKNMETRRVHFFWEVLTPAQRKQAVALGHAPPPD
jgi:hypothetical protein